MPTVAFTPEKFEELKRLYAEAVRNQKEQFRFENNEYHTGYAKYLIEYLSSRLSAIRGTQ